jgi:hypothetical protein
VSIQYELCDGYAVLRLVDTSAKEVEVIISTYQGARELVDAAEVIRGLVQWEGGRGAGLVSSHNETDQHTMTPA